MIELVIFSWVFATAICGYLWIRHALTQKNAKVTHQAETLAMEISFRLLATKDHPDHQWLVTKLHDALTHPKNRADV